MRKKKTPDWRLQAATHITEDAFINGHKFAKGSSVIVSDFSTIGSTKLFFKLPNPSGMFIDLAQNKYAEANSYFSKIVINLSKCNDYKDVYKPKNTNKFIDALENKMASIMFSICALEAFANEYINFFTSEDYTYLAKNKNGGIEYPKEDIEKNIDLTTKLKHILPEVFDIESPKGKGCWADFRKTYNLRNSITHPKLSDLDPSENKENFESRFHRESLWYKVLNYKQNPAHVSTTLIKYYFEGKKEIPYSRWLSQRYM